MTKTVLGSENTQYGFYGTINNCNSIDETENKWAEAFTTLLDLSGLSPYEIRTYLDSKSGRKLADYCNDTKNDVKSEILRLYFNWIEDDLYECRIKELQNPSKMLFGTVMHDDIRNQNVVILCEGTKKYRKEKYFKVIDSNENAYITRMDFLTPLE
ncbi:MAG: hypothetical protein VZR09_10990 [Candidatus Gastranaerophilaceae bacterium]|nr:hypothetical protein [Candidatus Gastranaerophilaceae bacterium]